MTRNLRERVAEVNPQAAVATTTGGEVARKPTTLAEQIESMTGLFQKAMPRGLEARQLVRDAMSLLRTQPDLAKCDAQTVLGGLMTFAQLGLRPGVLGHGWLIPFKARKKIDGQWHDIWQAQIVIGYKGYSELVHRSGQVSTMVGRAVHANDEFDVEYGLDDRLVHKPCLTGPRGDVVGYYSIIKYQSGGYVFWHMSTTEAEEWRDRYAMARKPVWVDGRKTGEFEVVGPWRDNFDEMAVKTTFLRAQRWAPKGTDLLSRAVEVDGGVRTDMDIDPDAMFSVPHPTVIDGDIIDEPSDPSQDVPAEDTAGNEPQP